MNEHETTSATFKRATERCKRLLGLVENSTTPTNRTLAVNRLLHLLQQQQNSIHLIDIILRRCVSFLRSPSWEVRVTGSMLLGGMIPLCSAISSHCSHHQEEHQHLSSLVSFDVSTVQSRGLPLTSSDCSNHAKIIVGDGVVTKEIIAQQRRSLMEHVGLSVPDAMGNAEGHATREAIGTEIDTILKSSSSSLSSSSSTSASSSSSSSTNKRSATDMVEDLSSSARQRAIEKRQRTTHDQIEVKRRRRDGLVVPSSLTSAMTLFDVVEVNLLLLLLLCVCCLF